MSLDPITRRPVRRVAASLAGLLAAVSVIAGMPASAQAPAAADGLTSTTEVAAPVRLGPAAPTDQVAFDLVLAARDPEGSARLAKDLYDPSSPEYRQFLTPEQIGDRFGPTDETLTHVREVLDVVGIQPVSMPPQRTRLSVTGAASAVGDFLGVPIELWQDPRSGMTYHATSTSPAVPAALVGAVSAVTGLEPWLTVARVDPADAPPIPARGLTPQDLALAYDYQSLWDQGIDGTGTSVGILQFGLDTDEDLAVYEATFGLSGPTPIRVPVNGGLSPDAPDGFRGEATLDTQVVRGVAPGTQIIVYGFPAKGTSFAAAMDAIVADGRTQFVSLSYGRCYAPPYVSIEMVDDLHRALEAAALAGVTLMVASGDWGAFSCNPHDPTDDRLTTDFPGCTQFALSVGGTMLDLNPDGTYLRETGWEDFLATAGTGGGVNRIVGPDQEFVEPMPDYQVGVPGINEVDPNRHCPDVSAVADSTTGYLIFQTDAESGEGTWHLTGGTSASAPLWAGVMALIQQKAQAAGIERIGFLNPLLYGIKASHPDAFHDVVRGGNLVDDSGPGWDAATGIGTPVVSLLADAVIETIRAPASDLGREWGSRLTARPRPHEGEFAYRHPIEVRYVDTDALGHVNNAVYISYFEAARAGYHARVTGHPFGTGPDASRTTFVIAEAHVTYRAPAYFGEPLVCEARVAWVSRASFGMEYRVVSEGGPIAPARLVADGGTTQVMFDLVRGRPTRMTQELLDAVERFEGRPIPRRS